MQKVSAIFLAVTVWSAVIAQFFLMMQNRSAPVPETIIRFFSFFTILTNILVALFFSGHSVGIKSTRKPGTLTAVAVYIFIVGIVYQVLLRHLWQPRGSQLVVDELLHSVIPLLTLLFWLLRKPSCSEIQSNKELADLPGSISYLYFNSGALFRILPLPIYRCCKNRAV
jgi:hypothetical protein